MQIYIKPELEWKLRTYSKQTGKPMSGLVNHLLSNYLRAKETEGVGPEPTITPPEDVA